MPKISFREPSHFSIFGGYITNYISTDPTQAGKGETVTASGPRGHWRTSQHVADQEP